MPKPTATGSVRRPADLRDRRRPARRPARRSRRSRPGARPDTRSPARPATAAASRSGRVVGRDEPDQIERARLDGAPRPPGSLAGRQVGEQHAGDAEGVGLAQEAVEAVAQNRIEVAEDHHRRASRARSISASVPASVMPCRSASKVERWMVGPSASGSLNGTPDLEDVGDLVGRPERAPGSPSADGIAGGQIGNQRGAVRGPGARPRPARAGTQTK